MFDKSRDYISTIPILDNARGKKILAESKSKVSNDDSSGLPFRNKNSSIHRLYTAENLECHENPLSFPNLSKKEKNSPPRKKNEETVQIQNRKFDERSIQKKKVTQFVHKTYFPIFDPILILTRQLTRSSPFHPQKDRRWKENARELLARERNETIVEAKNPYGR